MNPPPQFHQDELVNLLKRLGFDQIQTKIWEKKYKKFNCHIQVDFSKKEIRYPESSGMVLGDLTTSNFAHDENFVVLECVDRLLEKGYPPEKIELEKCWSLGKHSKGKLDILVKRKDSDKAYMMIECKTYGEEFKKETEKMLNKDGGQLFSYWQQDRSADVLCLYSSRFHDEEIEYWNKIVLIEDQFRDSGSVKEVHDRWNKQFVSKGLFESEINPYKIELKPLKRGDLKPLGEADGDRIYYQFLEILRHNIVSDKGNAFNKIFNLFLCKILDEDRLDSEELEFQWVEGRDDEESLLGRLNGLYKKGMLKYLKKDVTDYSADDLDIEDHDEEIRRIINELRLYKNQEFAFVDVFNKETFQDNAKIVIEIVKLLQGWQIRYTHKQQFLGEFFELLLNTGFKQEAGQFFTPVPLVRFILKSLPIDSIMQDKVVGREDEFLPYIIDFACGSGHFLTEAMDIVHGAILDIGLDDLTPAQKKKHDGYLTDEFGWAKEYIYGIERDYRLAKTSKLASFLNGDGEAIVIHASGLEPFSSSSFFGRLNTNSKFNESFDILVANPPYAVKSFKPTVRNGSDSFSLYDSLTDNSNEIEVLFIERMVQLLKPNAVVGIVLPRSILSNGGIYEQARQIIFENFELKGIVVLGSNAFFATGINTVVLFMRKRKNALHLNSLNDYRREFKEKNKNGQVVLVKSLEGDIEKRFLGYQFSKRKGSEGIRVMDESFLFDDENMLSENHANSYILRAMLNEPNPFVSERLEQHVELRSLDSLFDWESETFSNAIVIDRYEVTHEKSEILVSMEECISVLESGSRPKGGVSELSEGVGSLGGTHINKDTGKVAKEKMKYVSEEFFNEMTKGHVSDGDILICKDGAQTGKCAYYDDEGEDYCINEHLFRIRSNDDVCQKYLFFYMMSSFFQNQVKKLAYNKKGQSGLNRQHFKKIKVPLLSKPDQKKLISEVEKHWDKITDKGGRAELADSTFRKIGLETRSE